MIQNTYLWPVVRTVFLGLAIIQGVFFMGTMPGNFSKPVPSFFITVAAIVCLVVYIGVSLRMSGLGPGKKWLRPSWNISPFNVRQPLVVFDFASYFFMAMGGGCFVSGVFHENLRWLWELPTAVGFGAFIGVRAVICSWKDSFD